MSMVPYSWKVVIPVSQVVFVFVSLFGVNIITCYDCLWRDEAFTVGLLLATAAGKR